MNGLYFISTKSLQGYLMRDSKEKNMNNSNIQSQQIPDNTDNNINLNVDKETQLVTVEDAKTSYDYARPLRTVRELGELGLIGEFNRELGGFAQDEDQDTISGDEGNDLIHDNKEYLYLIFIRHIRKLMPNKVESYQLTPKQKSLIREYSKLAYLPQLSESNAERMGEILEIAESDDLLSSCIEKIDDKISEELGLFIKDNLDYYENQKAKIKEFLPVNQTLESYQLTAEEKSLIQEYSKLANLPELSESNAERMGEILEMAESDDLLYYWIEKIDEEISEKLGLFSEENLDYYENQKAKIKEFIVC